MVVDEHVATDAAVAEPDVILNDVVDNSQQAQILLAAVQSHLAEHEVLIRTDSETYASMLLHDRTGAFKEEQIGDLNFYRCVSHPTSQAYPIPSCPICIGLNFFPSAEHAAYIRDADGILGSLHCQRHKMILEENVTCAHCLANAPATEFVAQQ